MTLGGQSVKDPQPPFFCPSVKFDPKSGRLPVQAIGRLRGSLPRPRAPARISFDSRQSKSSPVHRAGRGEGLENRASRLQDGRAICENAAGNAGLGEETEMGIRTRLTAGLVGLLIAVSGSLAGAQDPVKRGVPAADAAGKAAKETEQKREFLRKQLTAAVRSRKQRQAIHSKLDALTPEQVDQLLAAYRAQLIRTRQQLQQQLLRQRLYGGRRPVGFSPVITWLPTGTSLQAGAVVSPDRRHVRINALPFFSHVPYYTFNLRTGDTRRYHLTQPRQRPSAQVQSWHDGLRTRYGKPPSQQRSRNRLKLR